jgi:hypothetical protein
MSGDDELDRLLREVDASLGGAPAPSSSPATRGSSAAVPTAKSAEATQRGRLRTGLRTGLVAGAVCGALVGVLTFLFAWLPLVDNPISSGMGAFVGAFLTGTVLGGRRRPPG